MSLSLDALVVEANERGVKLPTGETLAKYGLTLFGWLMRANAQKWACPICERHPARLVVDHEHVKGWAKMPPERRVLYVRGLTCWTCNRYLLARDISVLTARRLLRYLESYALRRPKDGP